MPTTVSCLCFSTPPSPAIFLNQTLGHGRLLSWKTQIPELELLESDLHLKVRSFACVLLGQESKSSPLQTQLCADTTGLLQATEETRGV